MASSYQGNISITTNEALVSVLCKALECKHNLHRLGDPICNLKHIVISVDWECENYDPREEEAKSHAAT